MVLHFWRNRLKRKRPHIWYEAIYPQKEILFSKTHHRHTQYEWISKPVQTYKRTTPCGLFLRTSRTKHCFLSQRENEWSKTRKCLNQCGNNLGVRYLNVHVSCQILYVSNSNSTIILLMRIICFTSSSVSGYMVYFLFFSHSSHYLICPGLPKCLENQVPFTNFDSPNILVTFA